VVCVWQNSINLLEELHTVVGRHVDTIELQQVEMSRLEAEAADLQQSCAVIQKQCDDDRQRAQQQYSEQVAQCNSEVQYYVHCVPCDNI